MKPESAVSYHASERAKQRWRGAEISVEEIERQLVTQEAEVYERENSTIWKILFKSGTQKIPIVYNRRLKTVITVLPAAELARAQNEIGAGLSKEERRRFFEGLPARERERLKRWRWQQDMLDPEYNSKLHERARKKMERVDSLPPDVREVVHHYGLEVVWEFWCSGVKTGNDIAILIDASRKAASANSPSLLSLFAHFGVKKQSRVQYLASGARYEAPPTDPKQNRYSRNNSNPNRCKNFAARAPAEQKGK